ncbi:SDR family NAD(P)-dependent oxidoreductase [Subtercola frigoramans]|uniref:NAD(P)-dependent dehydrogenase (Short-subunit alcohol dehydrogenase family) n=1 Tax=Subtercola frigoramans TaxID=120298 RepID=A0ABS2L2X7_9MICO|nr:SDR family NAD(P)-dependent oxidoreductase [Subtercola frigoramans]MBM7470836.1 NAD(P)-dependent dehydrogenase (short-subunit alcohol dehydrogenase family) [Subtercola frigoramans]
MQITDEVVVVSGGGSGIGLECAKQASRRGASVVLVDISLDAAKRGLGELVPGRHLALGADVTDRPAMNEVLDFAAAELGGLTSVIAAAGIVCRVPLAEVDPAEFANVFAVNVFGMQNTIAAAAPHLKKTGRPGAIVALGSVAANTGGGLMGSGVYAASKGAVVGLIRGYARELAPWGIRANVVAPAATETPMTLALSDDERSRIAGMSLIGRLCTPDEIASTVNFLLSEGSGAITGQVIQPNGGVYFN